MKLIVGLGNPGLKYVFTRHNSGFRVIDNLTDKYNLKLDEKDFDGVFTKTIIGSERVIVSKPMTFMNLSGEFIRKIANYYKILSKDIIVVYDELALPFGRIKVSFGGQSAGHNGIKSIISNLNTSDFTRVRIGIAPCPSNIKIIDFVLMNYTLDEIKSLQIVYDKAVNAIIDLLNNDVELVMNKYNSKI